jgi:hypothetical protein
MRYSRIPGLLLALGVSVLLWAAPPRGSPLKCDLTPNLDYHEDMLPKDVCGSVPKFAEFGHMAWQTLKALAWPAKTRGLAHPDRTLADGRGGLSVFETFKAGWEVFLPSAEEPRPWQDYPRRAPACGDALDDGALVLASMHKYGNLNQADLGQDGKPITHVVIAQNRRLVRYLTAFNESVFAKIVEGGLYKPGSLKNSDDAPEGERLLPYGSITIKSAWIELDGITEPERFHRREALVQDPDPRITTCRKTVVGLVALHIARKTESGPQWIWASFEHDMNVPQAGRIDRSKKYTFHDGQEGNTPTAPPPLALTPFPEPNQYVPDPYNPPPYNIERLREIVPEIVTVNDDWRKALRLAGSVWGNYKLVSIQWPALKGRPELTGGVPYGTGKASALPTPPCREYDRHSLANTLIETFLQTETMCSEKRNCMSCHNEARNYDFVWSIPLSHRGETRLDAISKLRALTPWSRNP